MPHVVSPLFSFNWTLIMIWVTVMVLFLILKKHFFEKVHNFVLARQNAIQEAHETAELTNRQADERLELYNDKILGLEEEGREIIKNAKLRAEKQAKEILDEANRKAGNLLAGAEAELRRQQEKAMSEAREQIAALAMLAAEKILEKQIRIDGQNEVIDRILEQAGRTGWQN